MINDLWAIVTIIGFWGWVLCTIGFILKVFPRQMLFVPQAALRWGGVIILFFIIWILGMANA